MTRFSTAIAAVIAVIALGYLGLWFLIDRQLGRELDHWRAEAEAQGMVVQIGLIERSGFPFRFRIDATAVDITTPEGAILRSDRVIAQAGMLDMVVLVLPFGQGSLGLTAPAGGRLVGQPIGLAPLPTVAFAQGDGTVRFSAARFTGLDMTLDALAVESRPRVGAMAETARVAVTRQAEGDTLELGLARIRLPDHPLTAEASPLGPVVERVDLRAAASGGPLPDPPTAPRMAAWRDGGGRVVLEDLSVDYGPLRLRGMGDLGVDGELRWEGALDVRVAGVEETLQALVAAGLVAPAQALLVTAFTAEFTVEDAALGGPVVRAPFRLVDGQVFLAEIPLGRLPPPDWPEQAPAP